MTVYHGTDKATAAIIRRTRRLKGCKVFGPGICTTKAAALNFACIKVQKYLPNGRSFARSQIKVLQFQMNDQFLQQHGELDNRKNVFTFPNFKSISITF